MQLVTLDYFRKHLVDGVPGVSLLDVGVSGGLDQRWRAFGDDLSALGIDPLVAETNRLSASETNANVKYLAAYVAWKQWDDLFPPARRMDKDNGSFDRTTAWAAINNDADGYIRENYNDNEEVVFSDLRLEIDELGPHLPSGRVDFLKTDTDGFDLPTLRSGDTLLSSDQVLGVAVECNFHGADHPYANNFANIDTYLRSKGFTLFELTPYRYAKAAMPTRFVYNITAQTQSGAMQWADGLYFRDFCNPRFEALVGWAPTELHILRQAMLLELFGQVDSAVELLVKFSDRIGITDTLIESLFQRYGDKELATSYRELIDTFQRDHTHFFPASRNTGRG